MPLHLRELTVLCLALAPMVASAQPTEARWNSSIDLKTPEDWAAYERVLNERETDKPHATRYVSIRQEPTDRVPPVYVAGGVTTIIRLPYKLHTRGTGIGGGGEGRFELVRGDRKVFVTPTRELAKGERFPLLVTLADGTVIPLSLTSPPEKLSADGEVQITKEPEKPDELRARLVVMTEKAMSFEARLFRALEEQRSAEHLLAGLLAGGNTALTSLIRVKDRHFVDGAGRSVLLETYASSPEAPRVARQVAAHFVVTNTGAEPVEFTSARALSSPGLEPVPAAFRTQPRVIPPGEDGFIAVVFDREALGGGNVAVDFFSKARGGQIEFSVDLTPGDFEPPQRSRWWPF